MRFALLEINKEEFSFSAGHFTIFSASERETLHGHNYQVSLAFNVKIIDNGLAFDYRYYKNKMQQLCDQLDRYLLLPTESPHLRIEEDQEYYFAYFHQQKLIFLKQDVKLLPVSNVTIEDLSHYFLKQMLQYQTEMENHGIAGMQVKVFNGPGQCGGATYGHMQAGDPANYPAALRTIQQL